MWTVMAALAVAGVLTVSVGAAFPGLFVGRRVATISDFTVVEAEILPARNNRLRLVALAWLVVIGVTGGLLIVGGIVLAAAWVVNQLT